MIEDNLRIAFSRIRLCSHRLCSETGRWYGVPSDQRLCPHCDGATIQDEQHIIEGCSLLAGLKQSYVDVGFTVENFFNGDCAAIAAFIYNALKTIEN